MQEFDPASLARSNGKEGSPVYIAFQGRVIDVSKSKLWKGGLHMRRHEAGKDLTSEIQAAPHGPEVLDRYPQAGLLKAKKEGERSLPGAVSRLLDHYPFLRRHIHPMLVHFPIVFMISPALFFILFYLTGRNSFETTAWYCVGAGVLFLLPAMATGFFTWWLNYLAKPMRPITIKIRFSILLLVAALGAFFWRFFHPQIAYSASGEAVPYFLLLLALIPIVSTIGWYGALLTFPLEKGKRSA